MKRIAIVTLTAAMLPSAALAEVHPAGAAARGPMPHHAAPALPRPGHPPAVMRRHHGPGQVQMHRPGGTRHHVRRHVVRRHHGINGYPHYRRVERGFALPHHWWGPQFQVWNWGNYGLPQPMHGGRWVRYYDDALMIDGHGRVMDGRWGMKWDEWQDQWGYDERGIPVYVGNGEFQPGSEDYAWVQEQGGAYAHGYGQQGQGYGYGQYGQHGYGYPHGGYGYAYGYPHAAGMVITETTVTTAPTVVAETVYVEEEVRTVRRHRAKRPKARCRCPKPAPVLPGERG